MFKAIATQAAFARKLEQQLKRIQISPSVPQTAAASAAAVQKNIQASIQNRPPPALFQQVAAAAAASSAAPVIPLHPIQNPADAQRVFAQAPKSWWNERISSLIRYNLKREAEERKANHLRNVEDVCMDTNERASSNGDKRLAKLNWWLNNLGVQRSADQTEFHRNFTNASLPKIFQQDWNSASRRVMAERGIERIQAEVLATTPRRWGKTWSVALFVLAMMLSCPGIRICVFSTGKRASGSLMEIVLQFMNNVEGLHDRVVKNNQEELYIADVAMEAGNSAESSRAKELRQSKQTSKLFCYVSLSLKKQRKAHV